MVRRGEDTGQSLEAMCAVVGSVAALDLLRMSCTFPPAFVARMAQGVNTTLPAQRLDHDAAHDSDSDSDQDLDYCGSDRDSHRGSDRGSDPSLHLGSRPVQGLLGTATGADADGDDRDVAYVVRMLGGIKSQLDSGRFRTLRIARGGQVVFLAYSLTATTATREAVVDVDLFRRLLTDRINASSKCQYLVPLCMVGIWAVALAVASCLTA